MKNENVKSQADLIALAIDTALPTLVHRDNISVDDEHFLFNLELCFLNCDKFSIDFHYEDKDNV